MHGSAKRRGTVGGQLNEKPRGRLSQNNDIKETMFRRGSGFQGIEQN